MAQSGKIHFYSIRESDNPAQLLEKAIALTGGESVGPVSRTIGLDDGWKEFLEGTTSDPEYLFWTTDSRNAPPLWKPGTSLRVSILSNPMSNMFDRVLQERIPESIRDRFVPCQTDLQIGWHDIIEETDDPPHYGRRIARAFFSFKLFGYGTPTDWEEYRRRVFDVPEVKQLKADLEAIVGGPMEQWVYWSI